ncbi:hypothetical protein B5M07_18930 (plasmid) [Sulfitobacter sp. D7]|nr:hypothetical protein B5M07_18930 [Sulfitobacter sp. D7]
MFGQQRAEQDRRAAFAYDEVRLGQGCAQAAAPVVGKEPVAWFEPSVERRAFGFDRMDRRQAVDRREIWAMVVGAIVRWLVEGGQADIAKNLGKPAIADGHMGHMPARPAQVVRDPKHAGAAFLKREMPRQENRAFHVAVCLLGMRRSAP